MITDSVVFDASALLDELRRAGAQILNPNRIRCPFHDDKTPSAGIYKDANGHQRFKCQALSCGFNGDVYDVRARSSGQSLPEVLKQTASPTHKPAKPVYATLEDLGAKLPGAVEAMYRYTEPDTGAVELAVIRWRDSDGDKHFIQARPVDGGFVSEAPPKPYPIYNRKRVIASEIVVVVEGEKCVHALHAIGIVATTNPGGAGKAEHADWTPIAGKTVYLWPDNDLADLKTQRRTGIAHMRDVARLLSELEPTPRIMWIDPDELGLPPKGDVVDYLKLHADVGEVLAGANSLGASAEVRSMIDDMASGKRRTIAWPWPLLTKMTKALLPGTLTLLCGDPGSAKSFMVLQAAMHWHEHGIKTALLELEEDRRWHNLRVLALRSGISAILDDDWVRDNPDIADELFTQHQPFLDSFGGCIFDVPQSQIDLNGLIDWIEKRAMSGCRVLVIDPITATTQSREQWIDDAKFVSSAKRIAEQFELSLVLVTHPRKGVKGSALLEDTAGGAAFTRMAQCVIWLKRVMPPIEAKVKSSSAFGTITEVVLPDRLVSILKARNSNGAGVQLAYTFEGKKLNFSELGAVIKEDKKK